MTKVQRITDNRSAIARIATAWLT
ncbi:MAG: hypothetical protein RJA72_1112, partial [Pseudomonadota bacterium]